MVSDIVLDKVYYSIISHRLKANIHSVANYTSFIVNLKVISIKVLRDLLHTYMYEY